MGRGKGERMDDGDCGEGLGGWAELRWGVFWKRGSIGSQIVVGRAMDIRRTVLIARLRGIQCKLISQ